MVNVTDATDQIYEIWKPAKEGKRETTKNLLIIFDRKDPRKRGNARARDHLLTTHMRSDLSSSTITSTSNKTATQDPRCWLPFLMAKVDRMRTMHCFHALQGIQNRFVVIRPRVNHVVLQV